MLLSPSQLERLCSLVYLDTFMDYSCNTRLGVIANDLIRTTRRKSTNTLVSETDFFTVLRDIITDKQLSELILIDYLDVPLDYTGSAQTAGNRIVVFADDSRNGVIVFRGTHGDAEWADNGARMYQTETEELLTCADYVKTTVQKYGLQHIVTAGHSGGGNKSMYCFLTCKQNDKYVVSECFSLDGQGFSPEFMEKYRDNIAERANQIVGYAERRDFVNCLGFYPAEKPLYFTGWRGETVLPDYLFGSPLPWFHLSDSVRNKDGSITTQAEISYVSNAINALVTFVLTSPDYASKKQFLCDTLVTLMMEKCKTNIWAQADAIAVMLAAALEIASKNSGFTAMIKDVIAHEKRLIIATALMLFGEFTKWTESDLLAKIKDAFKKHTEQEFTECDSVCISDINSALCDCDEHFNILR